MKAIRVRTAAAAALLLALGACGGKASFDVAGVFVDGNGVSKPVANSGLVLQNGSDNLTIPVGATSFKFANSISYGTTYDIKVLTPPKNMSCTVANGSGSAGYTLTISASVICNQNSYTIGGVIIGGIVGDTVVTLANGSTGGTVILTKDSTNFTFATPVFTGQTYGVAVLSATKSATDLTPAPIKCTLTNGTDVMGDAPRSNMTLLCVPV